MGDVNDDIKKYLKGEMTPAEMHALEKKALSDPFLADALDGGMSIGGNDFKNDLDGINERIRPRKNYTLRIAAGIFVLISLGIGLFFALDKEETVQIAKQEVKTESKKIAADSIDQDTERSSKHKDTKIESETTREPKKEPVVTREPEETTVSPEPTVGFVQLDSVQQPIAKHVVSGTVTTLEDGLPLPGVTILIKGSTQGTTTDVAGNYTLEVADTSSLVFSFVGMHSKELVVANKSEVDLKMTEDATQLGEVVVARSPMPKQESDEIDIKLAEPIGGIKAYDKYLEDNKRYPQQALDNDVKGRVIIAFDVGTSGELSNFVVIRSLGYGCDEEVMRLVKQGPVWNPTREANVPVESTIHVKMKFDAAKFKKKR